MTDPYMAEIRIFGGDSRFVPKGWAQCDGQFMQINQNQALFSLLGTMWGGNGQTNFQLPDLRGRVPIHAGNGIGLANRGGAEAHTLTQSEMPQHLHVANASATDGNTNLPGGNVLAGAANVYGPVGNLTTTVAGTVSNNGGSQPHTNMQPYLSLNICIALSGQFPSRA